MEIPWDCCDPWYHWGIMNHRSRRPATLLLTAALLAGAAMTPPASAAAPKDPSDRKAVVDQQIGELAGQLEDTSADLARAYVALRQTEARLTGARAALAAATAAAAAAVRHHDDVRDRLLVAQTQEQQAADALAATASAVVQARQRLGNLAADAYRTGGLNPLAIALDPRSPTDFADRISLVDTVAGLQQRAIRELAERQAEAQAQQAYLVAVRQRVAALEQEAAAAVAAARDARNAAAGAKADLDALAAQQAAYARSVNAKKAAEAARLTQLQAESDRLRRQLAAIAAAARAAAARRASAGRAAPTGGGVLRYPVNAYVSSEFGMRFHPIYHVWRLHAGIDFGAACGTPVYAAGSGRIVSAGWAGGYGNRVVIDHGLVGGAGLATTYNHMSRIARSGGSVGAGQLVGYVGTTGASTGCHLHFETRVNGTPVNPRRFL
ncbi:MAG TPA: M23 family metallopeptidase [Dermatophilaceae bacterium]|nr:M23 family metallopeptidase [Dermatophilaceae bacterium]